MPELQLFKVRKISTHFYRGSHVGGKKNAHQPIFPHIIIENSLTSLTHNSVSVGPNNFKFGTETRWYGLTGHIKVCGKLIIICIIMFWWCHMQATNSWWIVIILKKSSRFAFSETKWGCLRFLSFIYSILWKSVNEGIWRNMNLVNTCKRPQTVKVTQQNQNARKQYVAIDDYAKDVGPGEVWLLCSFYHESLRTWIKTTVNKFAISNHTALILRVECSQKLFEANLWIWAS